MAERYAALSYSIVLGRNCVDNIFVVFREIRLLDFSESGSKCGRFRSSVEGLGGGEIVELRQNRANRNGGKARKPR